MVRKSTITTLPVPRKVANYSGYLCHKYVRYFPLFEAHISPFLHKCEGIICPLFACFVLDVFLTIMQGQLEYVVLTSRYRWPFRHYGHEKSAQNQKSQPTCCTICKVTSAGKFALN